MRESKAYYESQLGKLLHHMQTEGLPADGTGAVGPGRHPWPQPVLQSLRQERQKLQQLIENTREKIKYECVCV